MNRGWAGEEGIHSLIYFFKNEFFINFLLEICCKDFLLAIFF